MKKTKKKMNDFEISMILSCTCYPALGMFLLIGSIFPVPILVIFIWCPVLWQLKSCFHAIRFLKQNPNEKIKTRICLVVAIVFLIIIGYVSLAFTGLATNDLSGFG